MLFKAPVSELPTDVSQDCTSSSRVGLNNGFNLFKIVVNFYFYQNIYRHFLVVLMSRFKIVFCKNILFLLWHDNSSFGGGEVIFDGSVDSNMQDLGSPDLDGFRKV